jgi:hypothetical protein
MDAMAASHEDHRFRRCEHIVAANRTVALSGTFDTPMCIFNRYWHAHTTCLVSHQQGSYLKPQLTLPCSGRNLCPSPVLYGKSRNHNSDKCSLHCHHPKAYTLHNNTWQLSHRILCTIVQLPGVVHTTYITYSLSFSGSGNGSQPHHDKIDRYTISCTYSTVI